MQSVSSPKSTAQNNGSEDRSNVNLEIAQTESCIISETIDFFGYERKSIFYQFFLFIDDIIKLHYWRQSYYILQYLVPIVQLFALSFYPYLSDKWDSQPNEKGYSYCKFIHGFACVFTLSLPSKVSEFHIPSVIAISAISGLIIAIIVICFLYYIFISNSIPFILPLLSFIVQNLLFIFYFPVVSAFSSSFSGLIEQTPINVFAFAFLLLVLVFFTAFLYFSSSLINFESNPSRSLFASYTGKHVYHIFMIFGICYILISLSQHLPKWIIYFIITLKIAFTIFLIFENFSFPYVRFYSNVFSASFYCMSIMSDILLYFGKIPHYIRLFLPLGIFIISFIAFAIIFNLIKTRILSILSILNENPMSESEREQFLTKYVNPKTLLGAYQFLRIGFYYKSVQILKGKVSMRIASQMNNVDYWISLTSIISFFPGERENFSSCMDSTKSLFAKTLVAKQRILHLMNLEQTRYLTGTNEIPQGLLLLEAATNNSIALTRQFWQDICSNQLKDPIKTLDVISGEINNTKNMWILNLHLFPNDYRYAALYSLFLVECLGKFEEGIIWLLKASHLERGFNSSVDELFKVFVCSLPYFLHDKVVNKYGNLLVEEKNFGETEVVQDMTQQDKLEEDIENGMIEQLLSQKFVWPTLRNYLSRATSHYRPKYLSIFTTLKIISFLIIILLLISINVVFSSEFTLFKYTYDIIESFNNIRVGLGFLYSTFLLEWKSQMTSNGWNPSTSLNLSNNLINLKNLTGSIDYWVNYVETNYINFFYQISKDATSGERISVLSSKLIEESIYRYFCFIDSNDDFVIKPFITDVKTVIASSFITLQSLVLSNYTELVNNSLFCEMNLLYPELPDSFTDVSANFSFLARHINKDSQDIFVVMLTIFLVFACVIWVPLLIVPQLILHFESKKIVSAMKSVDQSAAFAASQPLAIPEETDQRQEIIVQHHRNSYSLMIWLWRFLYLLLTLIIFMFVIVSFVVLHLSCNRLEQFIILDHFGSTRHGLCTEIFGLTIYKMLGTTENLGYLNQSSLMSYFSKYIDQIVDCSSLFIHGENNNGMSRYSSKIEKLHIEDKCEARYGDPNYYKCMSFQRAISSFIVLTKETMIDNLDNSLESAKFYELFHVLTSDVDVMNVESRILTKDLIESTIKKSLSVTISLLSFAAIFDIVLFVLDCIYINKLTLRMNTALLLIRHLPPPSVVETKAILDILLVETEDHKDQTQTSVNDVIFNTITSPTLILGQGDIIEKVNASFQSTFGLNSEKVVGHNLSFFIPQNDEDEGSLHLYEMLQKIQDKEASDEPFSVVTKCVSNEQDTNHDEVMVSVKVTAFAVHNKDDFINGFVILVEDKSRTANVENQLADAKNEVEQLINQLIPLNFKSAFRNEGRDFGYVIPKAIVVIVHVRCLADFLERNWEDYNALVDALEADSKVNPPFIFLQTVYDIISFIGGIIVDKEMSELASISLDFAKCLTKTLSSKLKGFNKNNNEKRFSVSISYGGPLIAGFFNSIDISSLDVNNKSKNNVNGNINNGSLNNINAASNNNNMNRYASYSNFSGFNSSRNIFGSTNNNISGATDDFIFTDLNNIPIFDVLGDLMVKATRLAIKSNSEDIIISNDTKPLLENDKSIIFQEGPIIDDEKTYLISSNND